MSEPAGNGKAAAVAPLRRSDALVQAQPLEIRRPARTVDSSALLRLALLNSSFALALVAARVAYHGHVHPVVYVAVALVLFVYGAGAMQAMRMATWESGAAWELGLNRLDRLASRCPKVAMAGTVTGFLIAFSGSTDDVQQRVRGASTGLIATLVGIAAMLLLECQHDWLSARHETH
jgi:hypothetical protein